MKIAGKIYQIYPVNSGDPLKKQLYFVEAVVRMEETTITEDSRKEPTLSDLAIRIIGKEKVDAFISEKKVGNQISAEVFPDCNMDKVEYPCNNRSFECFSWD